MSRFLNKTLTPSIKVVSLLTASLILAGSMHLTWAAKQQPNGQITTKPYDIYLSGNRICKKCTARYLGNNEVELRNRKGETGVYPLWEVQGVDTHPFARRFWGASFRGVGLPGRIIVPQAFDDEKGLHY